MELLPVLFWLIYTVTQSSADHLLFRQSTYAVKFHHIEVVYANETVIQNITGEFRWYNRTVKVINANVHLLRPSGNNIQAHIQSYKRLSNEYRYFPAEIKRNICDFYKYNYFNARTLLEKTSNIRGCPASPGHYYVKNLIPDYTYFPPHFPGGEYKLSTKIYIENIFVAEYHAYVAIEEFLTKWEN